MRHETLSRLFWPLLAALLLLPLGAAAPARPAAAAPAPAEAPAAVRLAAIGEIEPNDTTAQAKLKPIGAVGSWAEQVKGTIGSASDVDYYAFTLAQPASSVKITLSDLPGDYDLVLASDASTSTEEGDSGIEDITGIGGSIASIGGSIASIGGSIASIGGSIASIGGSIASIGGSIASISANPGTESEQIDTYLWLPGTYYVAVGPANGAFSATASYTLDVQVTGSGLTRPAQEAPTVAMRVNPAAITYTTPDNITTLYVINSARMNTLYSSQTSQSASVLGQLQSLASSPPTLGGVPQYGYVLDIAKLVQAIRSSPTAASIYAEWDANPGNPLYANKVARLIDNTIKAATDPARDGTSCPPDLPPGVSCPAPGLIYEEGTGTLNTSAPFPNVKYIVHVGGDNLIPFFRTPDLTTIANEADYAAYLKSIDSAGVINPSTPLGAALKHRMVLTDNPYGGRKPLRFQGFPLFAPELAVGRLVETPEDILRYLERWTRTGYTIDVRKNVEGPDPQAYVNAYDFLKDQGGGVSRTLSLGLNTPPSVDFPNGVRANINGPINDTWTRTDLESSWFQGDLTAQSPFNSSLGIFSNTTLNDPFAPTHPNKLFSLNSHFDHWQLLPAKDTAGNFLARRIYTPNYDPGPSLPVSGGYFAETLGYSVGCHSGYSVLDPNILLSDAANRGQEPTYRADFAQSFIRQAGNWVGNTGYGYGTADGIDYSERLSLLFTQELIRDIRAEAAPATYAGSAIGEALAHAKLRYLRNSLTLSAYDAKAMTVMTLYGLPFIRVLVDSPIAPPPEEPRLGANPPPIPAEAKAPDVPVSSLGRLERIITVTIKTPDVTTLPRTGSKLLELDESDFSVSDSFVNFPGSTFPQPAFRVFENSQVGLPSLPTFAYDISALNSAGTDRLEVRDVIFMGGDYAPTSNFNPQITQIVTETDSPIVSTSTEPNFAAGAGIWYPDKIFAFSSVGSGENQRDQLTSAAAQFKADNNGVTGQIRGYTKMIFKVYYLDPATSETTPAKDDEQGPVIQSVQVGSPSTASALAASGVTVVAIVGDKGTGMDGVTGVYVQNGTVWAPVTFTLAGTTAGGLSRYEAFIPLAAGQVRVIVSAADKAGNVSYYTAKGTFSLIGSRLMLPLIRR